MKKSALDKWICEKENIRYLTRDILDELQLTKLNTLLARVKKRKGFYSCLPEYLTSLKELENLPFTTTKELAENASSLLLSSQSEVSRVISGSTSGTTGPSKRIFYSDKDLDNTLTFFAAGISEMVSEGESVLITMPFSGGLGELIAKAVESLGARPIRAGSKLTYGELCEIMKQECPSSYIGMPIPLLSLLRFCNGKSTLKSALVSADVCSSLVQKEIENLLGSKLFPHYGLRESCLGGAITCKAHKGMHVRENHIIPEIIGKNGRPVENGEYGELVITTIGMELMPLIRYKTGDRACILSKPCPCGSVCVRIEVEGRMDDKLRMSDIDDVLFDIKELIDVKAKFIGNTLEVSAYVLKDNETQKKIQKRISLLCPNNKINIKVCDNNCKSLYLGKRIIE